MWLQNNKKIAQPWSHSLSPVPQTIQTRNYPVYLLNMTTTETSSGNDHSNHIWEMAVDSKTLSVLDEWYHTWQRDCSRLSCGEYQGVAAHLRRSTKASLCAAEWERLCRWCWNTNSCKYEWILSIFKNMKMNIMLDSSSSLDKTKTKQKLKKGYYLYNTRQLLFLLRHITLLIVIIIIFICQE